MAKDSPISDDNARGSTSGCDLQLRRKFENRQEERERESEEGKERGRV